MTKDELRNMAEKSGFEIGSVTGSILAPLPCDAELMRFATLVAQAEREACAREIEEWYTAIANKMASAIRARSDV